MDQEKTALLVLKEKISNCAAGFYFDCSRDDLLNAIYNICSSTIETHDYNKFADSIANVMFNKIYVEAEVYEPRLVLGLVDISIDSFKSRSTVSTFLPANAMSGIGSLDPDSIRIRIVESFNKCVREFDDEEIAEHLIEL